MHGLPMSLGLHHQVYLVKRQGHPVVVVDHRRDRHRILVWSHRDAEPVRRQVDQRQIIPRSAGDAAESPAGEIAIVVRIALIVARRSGNAYRAGEFGLHPGALVVHPDQPHGQCRSLLVDVEMLDLPIGRVRIRQHRLCQPHIEHQPAVTVLQPPRGGPAAHERNLPRRPHVQIEVLERIPADPVRNRGDRGDAMRPEQSVILGDERKRADRAVELERLARRFHRQVPTVDQPAVFDADDVRAATAAGVAQPRHGRAAHCGGASYCPPEREIDGGAVGLRLPGYFDPVRVGRHGCDPPRGMAGDAGDVAAWPPAHQHDRRTAVGGLLRLLDRSRGNGN